MVASFAVPNRFTSTVPLCADQHEWPAAGGGLAGPEMTDGTSLPQPSNSSRCRYVPYGWVMNLGLARCGPVMSGVSKLDAIAVASTNCPPMTSAGIGSSTITVPLGASARAIRAVATYDLPMAAPGSVG